MHNFVVHSNESACIKIGHLGIYQLFVLQRKLLSITFQRMGVFNRMLLECLSSLVMTIFSTCNPPLLGWCFLVALGVVLGSGEVGLKNGPRFFIVKIFISFIETFKKHTHLVDDDLNLVRDIKVINGALFVIRKLAYSLYAIGEIGKRESGIPIILEGIPVFPDHKGIGKTLIYGVMEHVTITHILKYTVLVTDFSEVLLEESGLHLFLRKY